MCEITYMRLVTCDWFILANCDLIMEWIEQQLKWKKWNVLNEKKKKQQANASRPVWIVGMNERLNTQVSMRREPKRKEQKRTEQTRKGTGRDGKRSLPETARVIFARGDDLRAVVVEGAREDLVRVALEHLRALAARRVPQTRRLVCAGRQHQRALRTERDLRSAPRAHVHSRVRTSTDSCAALIAMYSIYSNSKRPNSRALGTVGPSRPLPRGRAGGRRGAAQPHCRCERCHRRSRRRCVGRSCRTRRRALRPRGLFVRKTVYIHNFIILNSNKLYILITILVLNYT